MKRETVTDRIRLATVMPFLIPTALAALSIAFQMVVLYVYATPANMLHGGVLPAMVGVSYAILPSYIACLWIKRALYAIAKTKNAVYVMLHTVLIAALVVVLGVFMKMHLSMALKLASVPIKKRGTNGLEDASWLISFFIKTTAAYLLLVLACEAKAKAKRKSLRILLTVLIVILSIICISLYPINGGIVDGNNLFNPQASPRPNKVPH